MKLNLNEMPIIRYLKSKHNSDIIVDKTSYGLESDLVSILSENGEEVSIIDGKSLTSKHDLCERLNEVPNGYILFKNLTEIPENEDSDMIKANIRVCIKGDWRNAGSGVIFGSDWENSLAKKSVGVLIVTNEESYKTSRDLKMMLGMGICRRWVIGDNGREMLDY